MDVIIKSTDRILVIAPHADDESIGCGGMLSLYGPQCDILLLTDGRKGHTKLDFYKDFWCLWPCIGNIFFVCSKQNNLNSITVTVPMGLFL